MPGKEDLHDLGVPVWNCNLCLVHKFWNNLLNDRVNFHGKVGPTWLRIWFAGDDDRLYVEHHGLLEDEQGLQVAGRAVQYLILRLIYVIQAVGRSKQNLLIYEFANGKAFLQFCPLLLLVCGLQFRKLLNIIERFNRENTDAASHQERCTIVFKFASGIALQYFLIGLQALLEILMNKRQKWHFFARGLIFLSIDSQLHFLLGIFKCSLCFGGRYLIRLNLCLRNLKSVYCAE